MYCGCGSGKDIACSGVPFNWNGAAIGADPSGYLAGLRIGYIKESFDSLDDGHAKANAEATLEVLRRAGVYAPFRVYSGCVCCASESQSLVCRWKFPGKISFQLQYRRTDRLKE